MTFLERYNSKIIAEVEATSWHVRERIRVREFVSFQTKANAIVADVRGAGSLQERVASTESRS